VSKAPVRNLRLKAFDAGARREAINRTLAVHSKGQASRGWNREKRRANPANSPLAHVPCG